MNATIGFLAPTGSSNRDAEREHFLSEALYLPGNALGYHVSERLTTLFPDRALIETNDSDFNLADYARDGHCMLTYAPVPHGQRQTYWHNAEREARERLGNAWLNVTWQGHDIDPFVVYWDDTMSHYILAEDRDVADRFFAAVCSWEAQVHDGVLVFDHGHWAKDEDLFIAIKGARFDNLVLRPGLKEEIVADVTRFFAARATYERYGVPWKRGVLFAGPPGNGKTHAVKALDNALEQPCLYVKSFRDAHGPDEYSMRMVFERASHGAMHPGARRP